MRATIKTILGSGFVFLFLLLPLTLWSQGTEANEVSFSSLKFAHEVLMEEAKKPLLQLDEFYDSKLAELEKGFQDAGSLEAVLAVKNERAAFRETATEVDEAFSELQKLQGIYVDAKKERLPAYSVKATGLIKGYVVKLNTVVVELTQKNQLEEALAVKKEIDVVSSLAESLREGVIQATENGNRPASLDGEPDWRVIKEIFEKNEFAEASTTAGQGGGGDYRDVPESPGILIGFELQYSKFNNFDTVRGILPIFLTEKGRKEGELIRGFKKGDPKRVIAKKGYAVGGIDVFGGSTAIRRVKLTFMRIKGAKLDPSDQYDSGWHGEYETGDFSKCFSDGRPVVGVTGLSGMGIGRIRFLLGGK